MAVGNGGAERQRGWGEPVGQGRDSLGRRIPTTQVSARPPGLSYSSTWARVTGMEFNIFSKVLKPLGFPGSSDVKDSRCNPWVLKIPWKREWLPTPIFLPGESYGERSLVGYSPWGHKESETAKQLTLSFSTFSVSFINIFNSFSSLHEVNKANSLSILFSGGRDWFYRLVYFVWGHSEQTLSDSISYILAVLHQLRLQLPESRKQVQPSRHGNAHRHE